MAHFGKELDDFKGSKCIQISSVEQTDQFTLYVIIVTVGSYSWTVKHRYSEFHELNDKLTASYKLDKSLLPPKKIFGNQSESFIKKRQRELEIYLQTIIFYLAQHVPSTLAYFLNFDKYEIHGITQAMAEDLYNRGEALLLSREPYEVSSLQLYSLTERLKLPEPTCESGDVKKDLGHILDFITRCKHLQVICSGEQVGTSNIVMSKLPFDLTLFKSLHTLKVRGCNMRLILGLETLKQTLTRLEVHESTSSMKEVLLQDAHHWRAVDGGIIVGYWSNVTQVDFSHNSFSEIHESIQLLSNLEYLDMSHNTLENIQNLQWLSQLTHLDVSHNNIRNLDSLHTKLGNVKFLCLSHNRLEHLHGFAKLFSLQTLDVSHNNISTIQELWFVSQLPCIEQLIVSGNTVTNSLDYRTKTLEMFGDRVREVVLDKQPSDQKELDTVAVLQALRKAKNVKIVKKSFQQKNPSAVSLSDVTGEGVDSREGSRGATPTRGVVSRSVPSAGMEWVKRDSGHGYYSSSPLSQASVKSFGSMQGENAPISNTMSPRGRASADRILLGLDNDVTNDQVLSDPELDEECLEAVEQVPEAHPFDLNFDNLPNTTTAAVAPPASIPAERNSSTNRNPKAAVALESSSEPQLRLLNKLEGPPRYTEIRRSGEEEPPRSGEGERSHPVPSVDVKKTSREEECDRGLGSSAAQMRKLTSTDVITDLPGMADVEFVRWLEGQLLTSPTTDEAPTSSSSQATVSSSSLWSRNSATTREEECGEMPCVDSIVDILWCYCEQLSHPGELFLCCVILTRDKVVLERLQRPPEDASVGDVRNFSVLLPVTVVPICSIQQLVVGPCHSFLRLEEAFVGKPGTYTIFGMDSHSLLRFTEHMVQVCGQLNSSNTPECVDLTVQSDLLREIVSWEEGSCSVPSDRLAVAILIRQQDMEGFSFLVLSENCVYCLDIDFVHWPPAYFETSPPSRIKCKVLHAFSITDKISNFKIQPLSEQDQVECVGIPFYKENKEIELKTYQVDLQVKLMDASLPNTSDGQCRDLSYLFLSAAHRDLFLDRLTNLRAEQAHRTSLKVRQEPEGGNELAAHPANNGAGCVSPLTAGKEREGEFIKPGRAYSGNCLKRVRQQEEDTMSSGSAQTGVSDDNTTYYSASPTDRELSVSPMSNFSRASISPPANSGKTIAVHAVSAAVSQMSSGDGPSQANQVMSAVDTSVNTLEVSPASSSQTSHGGRKEQDESYQNLQHGAVSELQPRISSVENRKPLAKLDTSLAFEHLMRSHIPTGSGDTGSEEDTELEKHLRKCLRSYDLLSPLPAKLKPLSLIGGKDIQQFFRTAVVDAMDEHKAAAGGFCVKEEEVRHLLWTSVVPYTNPKHEIVTLVMVSTQAIYLVSDTSPAPSHKSRPSWMTHTRNQSDSMVAWKSVAAHDIMSTSSSPSYSVLRGSVKDRGVTLLVKPYFKFKYADLYQVDVGVFDQCVRLTGSSADSVFCLAVRDSAATEQLVQYIKDMLTLAYSNPVSPELDASDMYMLGDDHDLYRDDVHRTKSTLEGLVYTHPSQVKFVYPGEDAIRDILYLVNQRISRPAKQTSASPASSQQLKDSSSLWMYVLCHQLVTPPTSAAGDHHKQAERTLPPASQARSVIITPTHFSLSQEDIVTYPLPDFVRGLPKSPCHQIVECRSIEALKRVHVYHSNPHLLTLTFNDEVEDFVVDVAMEHFSPAVGRDRAGGIAPEVTFNLYIQSVQEKEKMVAMMEKLWKQLVTQVGRILDVARV